MLLLDTPRQRMSRILNQVPVFSYVTAPNAPSYRAIIHIFYEAKQRYLIEMRPAAILSALSERRYELATEDSDALENADKLNRLLEALVSWGNLGHAHDAAAVNRIEDFRRKRFIYHLTSAGEAAHRAILEVEATIGKSGSLQASMLRKIQETVFKLAEEAQHPNPVPDQLKVLLHDLFSAFDTLTAEANCFIAELTHQMGSGFATGVDEFEEKYFLRKRAILDYISRFIDQLRPIADDIATGIKSVSKIGIHQIIDCASQSADLPPDLGAYNAVERWHREQYTKWNGIRAWFVPDGNSESATVERLAKVAVEAVINLTRILARVNDLRSRAVDRAADFRVLASWFSILADDEQAHRLWHVAFGLYPSRHFHLAEEDVDIVPPSSSWWSSPPVKVPVRLGIRGRGGSGGRSTTAPDHSKNKALIAARRKQERETLQNALASLVARGPFELHELGNLSTSQMEVLLSLLDQALRTPRSSTGLRRAKTADGKYRILLTPPQHNDGSPVELLTPQGLIRCNDYKLQVEINTRVASRDTMKTNEATHGVS